MADSIVESSTCKTVSQGQWVYAPQHSYTGYVEGYSNGDRSGSGYLEVQEVIPNWPDKTLCSASGQMGISGRDLKCTGYNSETSHNVDARSKYTKLSGTANLTVGIEQKVS